MNRKRICLVTSEVVGPFRNGGIGTHCLYLAQFLSKLRDWETTIVYNGAIDKHDVHHWVRFFRDTLDAKFVWVRPSDKLSYTHWRAPTCLWDQISQLNYEFLKKNPQDLVIFQEMLGGGFRSIQAKRSMGRFANTELVVMVHSSWEWVNQSMGCLPAYGLPEMMTKFMERYSVQYCDELVSPSRYMLEWSKSDVPSLPARTRVLPYLFEKEVDKVRTEPSADEIIFFGRLEQRKGLVLFLQALAQIASQKCCADRGSRVVYLLGKAGRTEDGDGLATIERFRPELSGAFELRVENNFGHEEALEFLRSHPSALVVCPSLQDNSPYAVIENLELGTNLIACATGGIPELFSDAARVCQPEPRALADLIGKGLTGSLPPVKAAYSREHARNAWGDFLQDQLCGTRLPPGPIKECAATFQVLAADAEAQLASSVLGARFAGRIAFDGSYLSEGREKSELHESPLHCLVLCEGALIDEHAADVLAACVSRFPQSVWVGFTKVGQPTNSIFAPLGECLEASLHANLLGYAAFVVPKHCLIRLTGHELALLKMALKDPNACWPLLVSLSLSGWRLEVVPEVISSIDGVHSSVLEATSKSLHLRLAVLRVFKAHMPTWAARAMPYLAASATTESKSVFPPVSVAKTFGRRYLPARVIAKCRRVISELVLKKKSFATTTSS